MNKSSANKFEGVISFIRDVFKEDTNFIPLHAPTFGGNEKKYVTETIESTFVSSVGSFVDKFEKDIAEFTGSKHAVACVNGTNALQIGLILAGVEQGDEVITQALTFIATPNAISYVGASPVFIDVDLDTMGMSPKALKQFLVNNAERRDDGFTYNQKTGKKIKACVPMHTFGLPLRIDEIVTICKEWNIKLVEDAAESLGAYYKGKHTGTFGEVGCISFNGNKIITSGGGGVILTDDDTLAKRAKHLTTQAKIPHKWEYRHDEIGYNFRMPNLNAALLCAQLEQLQDFVLNKRELSQIYKRYFEESDIKYVTEIENAKANYWLNAILLNDKSEREEFLKMTNNEGVMTRPVWDLIVTLPMFENCQHDGLENSFWISDRLVNIPSSVRK